MADPSFDPLTYAKRVALTLGIGALFLLLAYLVWQTAAVLLLFFASILLMLFLDSAAGWLADRLPLSRGWALGAFVVVLLAVLGSIGWLTSPRIADQFSQLREQIPAAAEQIQQFLAEHDLTRPLVEDDAAAGSPGSTSLPTGDLLDRITRAFSSTIGALANFVVVIVLGVFLAANPRPYFNGVVRLFPPDRRDRIREVLHAMGHALRWWLVGRLASMTVVGILTGIGLVIVGVPLALILGLIAGLVSFVPYIGPIAGFIPAGLVAFTESPTMVLYVAIVFWIVQFAETNLITPLIQKRATSIMPAVQIAFQVFMAALAGILGILLATPLAVALTVAIQMLYVEDALGDSVPVLGQ